MSIQTNNVLQAQADKEFRLAMEQETQRQADEKAQLEKDRTAATLNNTEACELLFAQGLAYKELLINIAAICEKMNSGVDAETWFNLYRTRDNVYYGWERERGEACETFNKLVSREFDKEEFLILAQQYLTKHETKNAEVGNYKESTMKPAVFFEIPQPLTEPETISDAQLINFFEVVHKLDYYGSLRFSCAVGNYCINIQMRNNFVWRVSFSNNTKPAKSTLVDCGVLQNLTKISAYRQAYAAFYQHQKSLI
jgi:hypothetical protein